MVYKPPDFHSGFQSGFHLKKHLAFARGAFREGLTGGDSRPFRPDDNGSKKQDMPMVLCYPCGTTQG